MTAETEIPERGVANERLQRIVEVVVIGCAMSVMLYAIIDERNRKAEEYTKATVTATCGHDFELIRQGRNLQKGSQRATACRKHFDAAIRGLSPDYTIVGAALRSKNQTISLFGATVARVNANPHGQLGALSIPTVKVGHGEPSTEIALQFASDKQADTAFAAISTTLSKLK